MRKHLIKKISVILLFVFCITNVSQVYTDSVQKVRIGLFFNDSKTGTNMALPGVNVSAQNGIRLGFESNKEFTLIYEEASNSSINVKKDVYYIKSNDKLIEYDPGTETQGERIGPYHIKIGADLANIQNAKDKIEVLKNQGINNSFIAYTGSWQVWVGNYTNYVDADNFIKQSLSQTISQESFTIIEPSSTRIIAFKQDLTTILAFDDVNSFFQVRPKVENSSYIIKFNDSNKQYRGDLELRRISNSNINVINIVSLEEYLYSVVPSEIEAYSGQEALRAQAVAARTYTLKNLNKFERLGFNLCSTASSQVYKGVSSEDKRTTNAVNDTLGQTIKYNGKLAEVFYFNSSGGRTEDVQNVWGEECSYLKSVDDSYEDTNSYNYNWEKVYTTEKIKQLLLKDSVDIGCILDIKITKTSDAGRAIEVVIYGTNGEKAYKKSKCRTIFGLNSQLYTINTEYEEQSFEVASKTLASKQLNSNLINKILGLKWKIKSEGLRAKSFTFKGKGWGHAVGMSQEGAKGMAKAGFSYAQILTHYFTGTTVE